MNNTAEQRPATGLAKILGGENFRSRALATAPTGTNINRLTELALEAVRITPDLQAADPRDIARQVLKVAGMGLPIGPDGAYLVPYRNRKKGTVDVQLQLSYRALITLALRSGHVSAVRCGAIYENDAIEFQAGSAGYIKHTPALKNRGALIGAWGICSFSDPVAPETVEIIGEDEILKAKGLSAAGGKTGPWRDHEGAMARKTVLRRLFNYVPAAADYMAQALSVEDGTGRGWDGARDVAAERVQEPLQAIEDIPDPEVDPAAAPPSYADCEAGIVNAGTVAEGVAWCNTAAGAGLDQEELEGLRQTLVKVFPGAGATGE